VFKCDVLRHGIDRSQQLSARYIQELKNKLFSATYRFTM